MRLEETDLPAVYGGAGAAKCEVRVKNPTFKLEGVVKSKENMEDFEGPLTLILQLLGKNKIEIKDVKISVILEQYLRYLDEMKQMDLEIASDFIAMASHLMYIKAKTLLAGEEEEVSELEELISSLEKLRLRGSYVAVKEAAAFLETRAESGMLLFVKPPEILAKDGEYRYSHAAGELRAALLSILGRDHDGGQIPSSFVIPGRLIYPVGEKSEEIMTRLRDAGTLRVRDLFLDSAGRSELVASFMAVLELCKSGNILLVEEDGEFVAKYHVHMEEDAENEY